MRNQRKLNICRETVRELSAGLEAAVGGNIAISNCPCQELSLIAYASGCCVVSYGPGICRTGNGCIHVPQPSA
jgi:hypothetical protein